MVWSGINVEKINQIAAKVSRRIAKEEGWLGWRRERARKRMISRAEVIEDKFPGTIEKYGN